MRVVLCCLAKNEESYINDFVKWYLNIGVDTIYIYDNNDIEKGESLRNSIDKDLLDRVVIFNVRGKKSKCMQQELYTEFYTNYKDTFDWCVVCDIDEYLTNVPNIKALLDLHIYRRFQQIRIKWKLFGDDNIITRDMSIPVYKVFKKEITSSWNRDLITKGNLEIQGKCIVRGHIDNVEFVSSHYASFTNGNLLESCLPNGRMTSSKVAIYSKYNDIHIFFNHYMTKSLSEFIEQKMNRNDAVFNENIKLDYYWRINEKTNEKIEYLKGLGLWNTK